MPKEIRRSNQIEQPPDVSFASTVEKGAMALAGLSLTHQFRRGTYRASAVKSPAEGVAEAS
jgi:hypothetical protein